MHDSYTPLGGGAALSHMMLGEVSPGGVGVGLNGLLIMAILSVFIAGLMVGRTPEYLGKKIQAPEMKMVALYILAMPTVRARLHRRVDVRRLGADARCGTTGPHGFSEILYAFTSAANNNGSAFAGITAATAVDGHDARPGHARRPLLPDHPGARHRRRRSPSKQVMPATAGTFPTHTPLFVGLVIGVVIVVGGLTFFPALALGPIVEQLSL